MTKAWWLGFPTFKCPECGYVFKGVKFAGRFRFPRLKAGDKREEGRDP